MTRSIIIGALVFAALLPGCGPNKAPSQATAGPTPAGSAAPAEGSEGATMWGSMSLAFFDDALGAANPRPTFEVTSPQCSMMGENVWQILHAQAVIYGQDTTAYRLQAGSARFDGVGKSATMQGGVQLDTGTLLMTMEDMTWLNSERIATTDNPVTVTGAGMNLQAQSMRLIRDQEIIELHNVHGSFDLTKEETP